MLIVPSEFILYHSDYDDVNAEPVDMEHFEHIAIPLFSKLALLHAHRELRKIPCFPLVVHHSLDTAGPVQA